MAVENTKAFRQLVEVFMAEANLHGWPASQRAATSILSRRVEQGAALLRVKPATVLGTHLGEDQVRDMVRDLIPLVVADGGTGRDDEPDVLVSRDLAGRLVADLGQAGRFAASHRDHLPEAGLHNVVADACVILGAAISESTGDRVAVPGYGLRLARRALHLAANGITSGWILALAETGPDTLEELTAGVQARLLAMVEEVTQLLPELPPPRVHGAGG